MHIKVGHTYKVECHRPDGTLKWCEENRNTVVNEGLDAILSAYYKDSAPTSLYVGLTSGAGTPTFSAAATMATHPGFTETHTTYTESTRQVLTMGTVASQSVNNSSVKAVFTMTTGATINGAFTTDNSTKGGTSGTLTGGAAFDEGNQTVVANDTISVTITATVAAS